MGFSSGASAAKRAAKKAAAAETWNYLEGARSTGQLKKAEGLEGGADRYNAAVDAYNTRLAQVEMQMSGKDYTEGITSTREKYVSKIASQIDASEKNSLNSILAKNNVPTQSRIGFGVLGKEPQSSKERAAQILDGGFGGGDWSSALAYAGTKRQYEAEVSKYRGFKNSYRDLNSMSAAAKDLETYAAAVNEARKADKIDDQVKYQSSEAYQNLLASRKRAESNANRNSTVLAGKSASTQAVAETATKKRTVLGKA